MPSSAQVHIVQTLPPGRPWEEQAGMDVHLPAREIVARIVYYVAANMVGIKGDEILALIQHNLARALRVQAEMRMIAQDFRRLDELAREILVKLDASGNCLIDMPLNWVVDVDRILMTRTCVRCGSIIPCVPHTSQDCDEALIRHVIES